MQDSLCRSETHQRQVSGWTSVFALFVYLQSHCE